MRVRQCTLIILVLAAAPAFAGPPTITSAASASFNEGQSNSFTVTADGDPVPTFSVVSGAWPTGVSLDTNSGVISGVPVDADASYQVTLQASNGIDPAATQVFTLAVDRVPRVSDFTVEGLEDQSVRFPDPVSLIVEPDGQDVEVRIETLPEHGELLLNDSALLLNQTFDPFSVTSLDFVPDADWFGTTSFNVTVSDGNLTSPVATVTIEIANVNDAPVIDQGLSGNYEIDEDNVLSQLLTATDIDGDAITWSVSTIPLSGVATVVDGSVEYTPASNFNGIDTFTIRAADTSGALSPHVFTVTVNPVNDAPVITQGAAIDVTMDEDGAPRPFAVAIDAVDVDEDTLTWSLQTAASSGVANVSGTGASPVLDYQPVANGSGSDSFVVRVSDGNGEQADITVNVTIEAVNDAPIVTGSPQNRVVENVAYSYAPGVSDVEGDDVSWSISGRPSWASFDVGTGALDGTPGNADIGLYENIVISASDGADSTEVSFSIEVLADLDGDTVADIDDSDIDGDGIDNDYEVASGLDPRDASDANLDLDGDGVSNLDEFNAGSDAASDDYPPLVNAPADAYADATGLFTAVNLGTATAVDGLDGALTPTPERVYFSPGAHTVTWSATDAAGNVGQDTQQVFVLPQVSFGPDVISAEGAAVTLTLYLNGPAVDYPVEVPYTVGGSMATDGSDHDLVSGTAIINSGTETTITVNLVDDGAGEGAEDLSLMLGTPVNAVAGFRSEQNVSVREDNVAPEVRLQVQQNGTPARTLVIADGAVVVSAVVSDANGADVHSFDWSASNNMLVDTDVSENTFTFDPSLLTAGSYVIDAVISDGDQQAHASISVDLLASAPLLDNADSDSDGTDDITEGYGDADQDGVRDYFDAIDSINVLQGRTANDELYLLETEPGLRFALGEGALRTTAAKATVTPQALADAFGITLPSKLKPIANDSFADIAVAGLGDKGVSAYVVLPLQQPLPDNAAVYLLTPTGWLELVEDADNEIASAAGAAGYCPAPGADQYTAQLSAGDYCVRLRIQDGGAFDADGVADATVTVRGGVTRARGGSSGGGGSLPIALLGLLAMLGRHRLRSRK